MPAPQGGVAGERADVHDAAAPRRQHAATRLLAAAETAINQVPPGPLDLFQGNLFRTAEDSVPGHVAQEINAAKVPIQLGEHLPDLRRLGDVARHGKRAAAEARDDLRRAARASDVAIGQHQVRARLRQREGHGAPQAARRSRNESDASTEIKQGRCVHPET